MEHRSFGDRGRVRIMLWAAAVLFLLNFYMFVAARTAPATIEIVPVSTTAPIKAPRCFVSARVEAISPDTERLIEVRRVLAAEREKLREKTERFGKPELRVRVMTPSTG